LQRAKASVEPESNAIIVAKQTSGSAKFDHLTAAFCTIGPFCGVFTGV